MNTIEPKDKQMKFGTWGSTEALNTGIDALKKYQSSNWGRSNCGYRSMFLDFCTAYNEGRIEV